MERRDAYRILNVTADADPDVIRAAYRVLARKLHPDVNPGQDAEERFKEVGRAYEVLSNPEKRQMYDLGLTAKPSCFHERIKLFGQFVREFDL